MDPRLSLSTLLKLAQREPSEDEFGYNFPVGPLLRLASRIPGVKVTSNPQFRGGMYDPAEKSVVIGRDPKFTLRDVLSVASQRAMRRIGEHEATHGLQDVVFDLLHGPKLGRSPEYSSAVARAPTQKLEARFSGDPYAGDIVPVGIADPDYLMEQMADFTSRTKGYEQPNPLEAMLIRALTNQTMRQVLFNQFPGDK